MLLLCCRLYCGGLLLEAHTDTLGGMVSKVKPDGRLEVCLTPTCPVINKADAEVLRQYSQQEWAPAIREYAREHPYIIKAYREGFIIL